MRTTKRGETMGGRDVINAIAEHLAESDTEYRLVDQADGLFELQVSAGEENGGLYDISFHFCVDEQLVVVSYSYAGSGLTPSIPEGRLAAGHPELFDQVDKVIMNNGRWQLMVDSQVERLRLELAGCSDPDPVDFLLRAVAALHVELRRS